jgi:hypothetical protein
MAPGTGDAASRLRGGATGTAINMYQKEEASTFVHSQTPDTQVWDACAFMMTPYSHSRLDVCKINCLDSSTWGRPFPYSVFGFGHETCLCQQDITLHNQRPGKLLCPETPYLCFRLGVIVENIVPWKVIVPWNSLSVPPYLFLVLCEWAHATLLNNEFVVTSSPHHTSDTEPVATCMSVTTPPYSFPVQLTQIELLSWLPELWEIINCFVLSK